MTCNTDTLSVLEGGAEVQTEGSDTAVGAQTGVGGTAGVQTGEGGDGVRPLRGTSLPHCWRIQRSMGCIGAGCRVSCGTAFLWSCRQGFCPALNVDLSSAIHPASILQFVVEEFW